VLFNTWRQLLALFINLLFAMFRCVALRLSCSVHSHAVPTEAALFRISPSGPGALEAVDANASAIDNVSRWASNDDEEPGEPAKKV
jgi:hypothetical protein